MDGQPLRKSERQACARSAPEVADGDLMVEPHETDALLNCVRAGMADRLEALVHAVRQEPSGRAVKLLLELPCRSS